MLARHWRGILAAASLCAMGALLISLWLPKVYRATTYVLVSESKIGEASGDANLQQMAMLPTFVPFLDNDALIDESLQKLGLDKPPYALTVDSFRRGNHIDVRVPKSTRLLELSIEFPNAKLAADIANDLAQGAVRFNDRLNESDTIISQGFLKRRLEEANHRFADAERQRLEILEEARIEDREKELATLLAEKDALYTSLQQLRLDLAQNEVRSRSLEQALSSEPETVRLTKSVLSDPFLELATSASDSTQPLAVTEESLNQIRESLRREFLGVSVSTAAQRAGIEAGADRLEEVNRAVSERLQVVLSLRTRIEGAEQEYAMAAEAIRNARRQYEAVSLTVSSKSQDLKQIAPAIVPERPVRPRTAINTVLGFLLGAFVVGGAAAGMESYRDFKAQIETRNDDFVPPRPSS
jgi:uncharacterized protein involved in exopolysaccharide biosynthesis